MRRNLRTRESRHFWRNAAHVADSVDGRTFKIDDFIDRLEAYYEAEIADRDAEILMLKKRQVDSEGRN